MSNSTLSHFKLQDGSYFNFTSRVKKRYIPLVLCLGMVADGRSPSGLRHPLVSILFMVFSGMMEGNSSIKDCHSYAVAHKKWIGKYVPLPYDIPDATTISRALEKVDIISLQYGWKLWQETLGLVKVASADGKTMCGIQSHNTRHILSLFSHDLAIIAQEGVSSKENEIPAFYRLLDHTFVAGTLILADALHTQVRTVAAILAANADYLLQVKKNQKGLHRWLSEIFSKQEITDYAMSYERARGREITTLCTAITDPLTCSLFHSEWIGVETLICIHRYGTREGMPIDELVYAISSRKLTAQDAATHIRNHWCIENNLHWRKDTTYQEDHMNALKGAEILTFMRSMCVSIIESVQFKSFSDVVKGFMRYPHYLHHFMRCMEII